MRKEALFQRLDNIGQVLAQKEGALLLLGLDSVGSETERADDYSDLDFFVITENGKKQRFIDHLDWLKEAYPLAYAFQNAEVGYKIMFEDGIYGEYAVFDESETDQLIYSKGRVVWKADAYENAEIETPKTKLPKLKSESIDHAINEALTNLYVGLCRYARGEKLSAVRFIQGYAVDSILSILHLLEQEVDYYPDPFGNDRRLEQRYPQFALLLADMMQGYDRVPDSAIHILSYLEGVYAVNPKLTEEIRRLAHLIRGEA